jgi:putative inorganic carbon (HCO3(-)) transporter
MDLNYFSDIKGRVTSLFENPNVLGFYLATIFPLALYFLLKVNGFGKKLALLCVCALMVTCSVLTWSRGVWLAILVTTLIFLLIYTRKTLRYLLLSLLSIPFLAYLLPETVIRRFLSIGNLADSSTSYRVYTWRGTWDAICDYFTSGVGYGVETYQDVYPGYAYAGMASAEHSHSLLLQILFSMGVFALIVFLFIVLLFVQRNLETIKISNDRTTKIMLAAVLCCGISLLIMGLFDYIWYQYRIFFLFWTVFGLASAIARIDAYERERKQMLQVTEPEYASVDLEI